MNQCQHPGCAQEGMEIEVNDGVDDAQIVYWCEWHCFEHGICRACLHQISAIDRSCGCIVDDEALESRDIWERDLLDRRENDLDLPGCQFPGECKELYLHYQHECRFREPISDERIQEILALYGKENYQTEVDLVMEIVFLRSQRDQLRAQLSKTQ